MKINRIELFYVKIPLSPGKPGFFAEPAHFMPSWIPGYRQSEVRFYLLKLTTDSGHEGVAAMPAMGPERKGLGPLLGNYIMGINPMDISLVNQRIQEFSYIGMRNGWVDAAFWDIIGKIKDEPLWKILGGKGGSVYPYVSTGSTHDHDKSRVRDIVRQRKDEGYRGIKLRVKSASLPPMVAYVEAGREAAGPEMDIMVDANQGWPVDIVDETPKWDIDLATRFARAIEPFRVKWLEEPLNRGNFEGARKELEAAMALKPFSPEPVNDLGLIHLMQGKPREAEKWFRKAVVIDPSDASARINLGMLLMRTSRLKEAETEFVAVLKNEPENVIALVQLGVVNDMTGRTEAAILLAEKARDIAPDDHVIHDCLEQWYAKVGRDAESREAGRRRLELQRELMRK